MAKIIDKSKLVQRKNNGLVVILSGNTASRPTTNLSAGDLYFNTELECLQVYDGTTWVNLDPNDYTLPQANETTLGGIKASSRNSETDTTEVKIDPSTGKLYVPESGGGIPYSVTSGTSTAYTTTITGISSYTTGMVVAIKFHTSNGEYPTLNINGLGAKSIYKNNVAPLVDAINADDVYLLVYDGANFKFTDRGGIPEAPDYEGLYLRDGFNETWIPTVEYYSKADFGDVEIDPYDKTSLSQFITVANPTYSTQAMYYSDNFRIFMDTKNVTLVDHINQKQEILTNVFGMIFNNEDPKWVAYKDLGSIKYLGTFDDSNDAMDHVITNNLPTGIYKAKIESSGGFEVLVNYQRTLTTATATVQSFNSFSVIEVDLTVPEVVRNDMFFVDAHSLPYDNTGSGLSATNVGQAIDELSSSLGDIESALDAILGV